jgi:integrase
MATLEFTTSLEQADLENAGPRFVDGDPRPRPRLLQVAGPLYLQITPGKSRPDGATPVYRSWLFKFSIDGHRGSMGLGPLSELPLAAALGKAFTLQEKVNRKENPVAEEQRARRKRDEERDRKPITFAEAAGLYAADRESGWSVPGYKDRWLRMLEIHARVINNVPVADITRDQIKRVLAPLWGARQVKTGKDLRGRIERVLTWAIAEGHRAEDAGNPATWVGNLEASFPKPSDVRAVRNHSALHYSKAPAFMAELRSKDWLGARATEFAILTVARANEVIGMRWGEVDWCAHGGSLWTVPAKRMKKRREHVVPLSKAAQAVLRAIQGDRTPSADELVFHGEYGQLAENSLLKSVRRIDPTVTQHGFRATFSSWRADRTNFDSEIAEFALAHVSKGVEAVYKRTTAIEKRRVLMEAWADYLNAVEGDKVVMLKVAGNE